MNEILADFLNAVKQLTVADYLIIISWIIYAINGFRRGFALDLIHIIWLGFAFVFASSFYQPLSNNDFLWFLSDYHLLSFILLFVLFFIFKTLLYKFLNAIANLKGPCPLNRILAILLSLGIVLNISWVLASDTNYIGSFNFIIGYEELRFVVSFLATTGVMIASIIVFVKIFNVKVDINRPCPLLASLIPLDAWLNAQGIDSVFNNIFGLLLGLFKASIMIVLLVIILHQFNLNVQGVIANNFDNMAITTQNILSNHLTFIKK